MKQLVFGCILLVGCNHSPGSTSTATVSGAPRNAKECKLPSSWTKMDVSFPLPAEELVVLDWRVRSDSPMIVTEDAFVWFRGHAEAGAYWFLTTLYRNPKAENEWHVSAASDAPITPQARFDHAPTNEEVDSFLKNTTWSWHQQPPDETVGRRCDAAWTRVIGAAPPPSKVF